MEINEWKTQQKNHGDVLNDSLTNIIAELKKEKRQKVQIKYLSSVYDRWTFSRLGACL